jgi:hypothetical protein
MRAVPLRIETRPPHLADLLADLLNALAAARVVEPRLAVHERGLQRRGVIASARSARRVRWCERAPEADAEVHDGDDDDLAAEPSSSSCTSAWRPSRRLRVFDDVLADFRQDHAELERLAHRVVQLST